LRGDEDDFVLVERVDGDDFFPLGKGNRIDFPSPEGNSVLLPLDQQILPVFDVVVPMPYTRKFLSIETQEVFLGLDPSVDLLDLQHTDLPAN
jgi:hypothetical protein